MNDELRRRQALEIDFWRDSPVEGPDSDSLEVVAFKFQEARWLLPKLEAFREDFARSETILELGGGQGWASCIVKRTFPESRVITSDISPYAIASAPKWERLLDVSLDGALVCKSYEVPVDDESFDLVLCVQSAHHFVAHQATIEEVFRVLRPGGVGLYLHEPSCRRWLYRAAHWRANRRRPVVPEDVLDHGELVRLAEQAGFDAEVRFDPDPQHRRPAETVYFLGLSRLSFLCPYVPCTADYVFRKPSAA